MNDIIIIGSGPSSMLTLLYLVIHSPYLKYTIISSNFKEFHCTYGVFLDQIKDSWIFKYLDKDKLFSNIYDIVVKTPLKIKTKKKYGLIDKEYIYNAILKIVDSKAIFAEKKVTNISKISNTYFVKCEDKTTFTSRFVFEGTGKYGAIGVKYKNSPLYKQYFLGYMIKLDKPCNLDPNECILLDWENTYESYIKSFGYIIPYNKKKILFEETVLNCPNNTNPNYELLRDKLKNRLHMYNIKDYTIEFIEKDSIPLNMGIPCEKTSYSFGIGQCGNIINTLSGYTIGYNIQVIPEICNLVVKHNYNLEKVYLDFWTFKRRVIYNINLIGLKLMNTLSEKDLCNFHHYYFKYIINSSNFNIMFLNNNNYSPFRLIFSFRHYIYFPKKYLWNIGQSLF